eukprot:scaffold12456_cov36-Tisochrysis_lutea.AAC.3
MRARKLAERQQSSAPLQKAVAIMTAHLPRECARTLTVGRAQQLELNAGDVEGVEKLGHGRLAHKGRPVVEILICAPRSGPTGQRAREREPCRLSRRSERRRGVAPRRVWRHRGRPHARGIRRSHQLSLACAACKMPQPPRCLGRLPRFEERLASFSHIAQPALLVKLSVERPP